VGLSSRWPIEKGEKMGNKPKLKATIAVMGNMVVMRILEMDERFRDGKNSEHIKRHKNENGICIRSSEYPQLSIYEVFLRGAEKCKDHNVAMFETKSESSAIEYAKLVVEALEDWSQNWEGFKTEAVKKLPANEFFYKLEL
jgi:hypothetical protein